MLVNFASTALRVLDPPPTTNCTELMDEREVITRTERIIWEDAWQWPMELVSVIWRLLSSNEYGYIIYTKGGAETTDSSLGTHGTGTYGTKPGFHGYQKF